MAKKQELEPEISEKETEVQKTEDLEAPKKVEKPEALRKFSKFKKGKE